MTGCKLKGFAMGNGRDNTGQPYEILVQAIFQAIHDQWLLRGGPK